MHLTPALSAGAEGLVKISAQVRTLASGHHHQSARTSSNAPQIHIVRRIAVHLTQVRPHMNMA